MVQQGIKIAFSGEIHTVAVSSVFDVKLHINLQCQMTQKQLVLFPKPLHVPFPVAPAKLLQFLCPLSPFHISISIAQILDFTAQPVVIQERLEART